MNIVKKNLIVLILGVVVVGVLSFVVIDVNVNLFEF